MAGTDYSSYLRIDELLDLQHPLTEGAHDELLFVVIHQAYELWFKVILHELDRAVAELLAGRPQGAMAPHHPDRRVAADATARARDPDAREVPRIPRPAQARLGTAVGTVSSH